MAGGASQNHDGEEGITEINIIPLVDIVLVLLIIFMVTAQFLTKPPEPPPGMDVQLPKAASSEDISPSLLSLVINKKGEVFLNGSPESAAGIDQDLKAFLEGKVAGELEAVLAADQDISHGHVIRVIDALRLLGVDKFAINTRRQDID